MMSGFDDTSCESTSSHEEGEIFDNSFRRPAVPTDTSTPLPAVPKESGYGTGLSHGPYTGTLSLDSRLEQMTNSTCSGGGGVASPAILPESPPVRVRRQACFFVHTFSFPLTVLDSGILFTSFHTHCQKSFHYGCVQKVRHEGTTNSASKARVLHGLPERDQPADPAAMCLQGPRGRSKGLSAALEWTR